MCGLMFPVPVRSCVKVFCSKVCRDLYQIKDPATFRWRTHKRQQPHIKKVCVVCASAFKVPPCKTKQQCCSRVCADRLKMSNAAVCEYCKHSFRPKSMRNSRFCTREHAFEWMHEQKQRHLIERRERKRLGDIARAEQKRETAQRLRTERAAMIHANLSVVFCCRQCATLYCRAFFTKGRGKETCSDACEQLEITDRAWRGKQDRKARMRKQRPVESHRAALAPRALWKRSAGLCACCCTFTPWELRGKNRKNSPEVDHIVPVSRGGVHSSDNLRLLCRSCNISKGSRLDAEWARWALYRERRSERTTAPLWAGSRTANDRLVPLCSASADSMGAG